MKGLNTITRTLLLAVVITLTSVSVIAGTIFGYVYTREVVTNDDGHRTWGEFDPATGTYIRDIAVATGEWDPAQWRVMSADEFNSNVDVYNDLKDQFDDLGEPITRSQYEADKASNSFLLATGETMSNPPSLGAGTAYVSVLPEARRLIDDPQSLILAEYTINPTTNISDSILSMLVKFDGDDMGRTKAATGNRIGFKTAFAKDEDGNPIPIDENEEVSHDNPAVGPISGAILESMHFTRAASDSRGFFSLSWYSIPCPMVGYDIGSSVSVSLRYRRFNPKARDVGGDGLYMDLYPAAEVCTPNFYIVPFFGPIPTGWEIHTFPNDGIQFGIDVSVISSIAQLSDPVFTIADRVQLAGNRIPIGEVTQYKTDYTGTSTSPDNTVAETPFTQYDLDDDGETDTMQAGHYQEDENGEYVLTDEGDKIFVLGITDVPEDKQFMGVWLSSSDSVPGTDPPDLTRVMDSNSFIHMGHLGLLDQISAEDLRNTDIYIVRMADGKLISERIGLNEYEADRISSFGEDTENNVFFYTIQMQGSTGDKRFKYNQFEDYQSHSGINPELHQRESDLLQPGDRIRIYAINRATGYIGHTETEFEAGRGEGGDLSFHVDAITMGPPNLRIKVERSYTIEKGIEADEKINDQIIGFEGASLTSDTIVELSTKWLDHDGRPLPDALTGAGYTGRVAILSGNQTLPNDNQGVHQFSIEPGEHLQLIQLPTAITDSQHFYIHVSGEPQSGNPIFTDTDNTRSREADFTSTGTNPGILAKRPNNYVPFLVPLYDEALSELQEQTYRQLKRDNPDQEYDAPDPIYSWVYRPEMQFTSYDLKMTEIQKEYDKDGSGTIENDEIINILDRGSELLTPDSVINILYDLSTTDLLPLDYFNAGEEKELVFIVGEQELYASLGDDQKLIFDDLTHISLLNPDDYLTILLYSNNDMGNVLWQYAFATNDIDIDSDNNNGFSLPEFSSAEERDEFEIDDPEKPGKIIVVELKDTDKTNDDDQKPDYADFDPATEGRKKVSFTPIVVHIPLKDSDDKTKIILTFNYSASDPSDIKSFGDDDIGYQYIPAPGHLRIWTKKSEEARDPASVLATPTAGQWVEPEVAISLDKLPDLDEEDRLILYIESVSLSQKTGDHVVQVDVKNSN